MNIIIPKIPEKTIALPAKSEILKGIVLIALARAELPGMSPLGLAFAATFSIENAYIALIGLCAGMADSGLNALKYILSFFVYYILIYMKKTEDSMVKSVALGVSVLIGGTISLLWNRSGIESAILLLPEVFVAGGAFYLFNFAGGKSGAAHFAELVIIGGILNGLSGIFLPYINVSAAVFAALFISMSLCYACEPPIATLACAALGFVMSVQSSDAVLAAGAFAISGMLSSLLAASGKFGAAVGFLSGIAVSAMYKGSLDGVRMMDIFMPLAVFVLIPESIHFRISSLINSRFETEYEDSAVNVRVANQLKTVAKAVCDLADGVTLLSDKNKENAAMKEMFDTVASRVCRDCSLEGSCWRKDSKKTYDNMYELWRTMEEDGFCDHSNMPLAFRQVCMRSESFLCEFKHAYEMYKQNVLYRGEALSGRDIMARQYGEISKVINMLSHEVEGGGTVCETAAAKYRAEITVQQEAKPGQAVCGDTILHFQKDNKYFVILCDGMGCGNEAMSESRLTARLFSQFLKAGFEKETAVNMINSALALKADQESFSTVDLLELDLETGVARFLKIGSAQSFLKTKSNIEVISSKALPIGILESIEVSSVERELKSGDMILMASDGVGEAGSGVLKNDWIKKLLMMENRNDEELAKLILVGAKARMKFSDDMTCVVIRIKKSREG
ncbi:MAG: SpoIIE family protein phosphatase [Clostridia bacterium]|nr:SpoIIE family protein phosphatase [Clostridia bacterium]